MSVLVWWCLVALSPHAYAEPIVPILRAECAAPTHVLALRRSELLAFRATENENGVLLAPKNAQSPLPYERPARPALRSPWTWVIAGTAVVGLSIGAYWLATQRRDRTLVGSLSWGS